MEHNANAPRDTGAAMAVCEGLARRQYDTLPNVIIAVLARTAVAWHALTGDAARRAVEAGVAAVVVAKHGGRQLDGVAASLRAWPAVVAAVQGQSTVVMDGGIRYGTDLVKALCLSARAGRCGHAYAEGLAAAGEAGVARAPRC